MTRRPALAAALLLPLSLVGRPGPHLGDERSHPLAEHEEGAAKRRLASAGISSRLRPLTIDGESRGYDVLTYDVSIRIDPGVTEIQGEVRLELLSRVAGLSSVRLDLASELDLVGVERSGAPVPPLSFVGDVLTLPLDPPLGREGRAAFTVRYRGIPRPGGGLAFWGHATGLVATSVAEPFDGRTFWPSVDSPDDKAVTTISLTVPPGYVSASAGLGTTVTGSDGWQTTTWRFGHPVPTYLVSLAVANFTLLTETYTSRDGARTMPVVAYAFPEHTEPARSRLQQTVQQIGTLAELFGEYPFLESKYGFVEGHFSGGMEHPTLTMVGANLIGNAGYDLTFLLVHELAHQWWGDHVTMATWDDIWLNEGFATYSEVLYAERTTNADPGRMLWSRYDDGLYAGRLGPAVVADPADPFRYTGAIYNKGGWVVHMLRREVGDAIFFAGLKTWGARFANGNATRHDLRRLFEELSGKDLKQFFDQWLETPYRPVLRGAYRQTLDGATIQVDVTQSQTHQVVHPSPGTTDTVFYRLPLTLRVTTTDGVFDAKVVLDAVQKRFDLPNPGGKPLVAVQLDPDHDLLRVIEAIGPG